MGQTYSLAEINDELSSFLKDYKKRPNLKKLLKEPEDHGYVPVFKSAILHYLSTRDRPNPTIIPLTLDYLFCLYEDEHSSDATRMIYELEKHPFVHQNQDFQLAILHHAKCQEITAHQFFMSYPRLKPHLKPGQGISCACTVEEVQRYTSDPYELFQDRYLTQFQLLFAHHNIPLEIFLEDPQLELTGENVQCLFWLLENYPYKRKTIENILTRTHRCGPEVWSQLLTKLEIK
ncbi:MAG: hypothetical protein ACYCQJ_15480 [Nitrososphaerales archaeon]